jgi:tetratricopeptide (TPR) repeat protein
VKTAFRPTRFRLAFAVSALVAATLATAQDPKPELISPLGAKHFAKADEKGDIAKAETEVAADPKNVDRLLALARAQSAAWRYRDAIATYTRALEFAPQDARLFRHRGHRYISVRQFDKAVADLKRAAQINDRDFDIWYHLGLAHYLHGEFAEALAAYEKCYAVAERDRAAAAPDKEGRDDALIAISDWLYMTYRRLNKPADAARILEKITPDSKVKENKTYFDRLLFYKGLKKEDELINIKEAADLEIATVGYGLGNWHLYNGNRAKAEEFFRRIVAGKFWPAFAFIAAEAELARSSRP